MLKWRPQLTAGIRAGSYDYKFSNLRNPRSNQRRASSQLPLHMPGSNFVCAVDHQCGRLSFTTDAMPAWHQTPLYWSGHIYWMTMDHLWTPWRYAYVTSAETARRPGVPKGLEAWPGDFGCVFCNLIGAVDYAIANGMRVEQAESAGGLVLRGRRCFICLNAFPYTSGHVMIVPYAHLDRLALLPAEAAQEMMELAQRTERVLQGLYTPHGFNFGMNVGQAAGAGVAGHIHLHAMPRWVGDTNFMTTVAETRVLPEDLETTWRRLREGFAEETSGQ